MGRSTTLCAFLLSVMLGISMTAHADAFKVILPADTAWPAHYAQWAADNQHEVDVQSLIRIDVLEQQLSDGLFEMGASQRIAEADRRSQKHSDEIMRTWRTAMLIHKFELDQLPAIIVNNDAVYYGLNPREALDLYQRRMNP